MTRVSTTAYRRCAAKAVGYEDLRLLRPATSSEHHTLPMVRCACALVD
jgi:hypothetical protein